MATWDAAAYAENNAHHRRHDDEFLSALRVGPDATIVDVGCGVGEVTRALAERVPGGAVIGVDQDPAMVEQAATVPGPANVRFVCAPVQELLTVVPAGSADAVVSIACLHWVPRADQPVALAQIAGVLKPGGTFRADLGGAGNIVPARRILDEESVAAGGPASPWYFPSPGEYRALLTDAGMSAGPDDVRLVSQRRVIPTADDVVGWLRSQVCIAYLARLSGPAAATFTERVERRAVAELRRPDGSYDQDYVRLDVLAHRN